MIKRAFHTTKCTQKTSTWLLLQVSVEQLCMVILLHRIPSTLKHEQVNELVLVKQHLYLTEHTRPANILLSRPVAVTVFPK